jgi:hypothetical protein
MRQKSGPEKEPATQVVKNIRGVQLVALLADEVIE